MPKVIIEMSMSLDGFVAGPDDGKEFPNGRDGIKHVFGWLSKAKEEGSANKSEVDRMRSKDEAFAEKVEDIVGLYTHPPAHAVVLSIDEKSQIQALNHTQPSLPRLSRGIECLGEVVEEDEGFLIFENIYFTKLVASLLDEVMSTKSERVSQVGGWYCLEESGRVEIKTLIWSGVLEATRIGPPGVEAGSDPASDCFQRRRHAAAFRGLDR